MSNPNGRRLFCKRLFVSGILVTVHRKILEENVNFRILFSPIIYILCNRTLNFATTHSGSQLTESEN